ncbi:MAG: hypothetical protein GXX91_10730 [Verrucomicrobiaceae bacterium]|nr:hypothetical protein [Verrucomicrobiaceae bacterium]
MRTGKARKMSGTTLVELLASMGILSILLLVLGATLDLALARFRGGAEKVDRAGEARVAAQWLERDLSSAVTSRSARLPRLPAGTTPVQRAFFEGRLFLPFEVNRTRGTGFGTAEGRSFQNAAPGFDSLVFATGGGDGGPAIVGYYVAYARHSPLGGDDAAGMKLFRHYRPGASHRGDGSAGGLLAFCSQQINDGWDETGPGAVRPVGAENPAAVRRGRLENADLPFVLARRFEDFAAMTPVAATQPWPTNPVRDWLKAPPPDYQPDRGGAEQWADPASPLHDSVFPDESVCDHVVRFQLEPRCRVEREDGTTELMDAPALNRHLGLSGGDEWPVLVAPDFIEMTLTTIGEKAALTLTEPGDWIVDFSATASSDSSPRRRLLEREMRTYRRHIPLPRRTR